LQTTPTKAKALKAEFDRVVNKAKKDGDHNRRQVEAIIRNDLAMTKLYTKILPRLAERSGGYTRSARTLPRKGDNAEPVIVMVHGAEIIERKSRLAKALEKKEKTAEENVATKLRKRVQNVSVSRAAAQKKENVADTRRNSK
jgi:large subunit ribosomal protein L17